MSRIWQLNSWGPWQIILLKYLVAPQNIVRQMPEQAQTHAHTHTHTEMHKYKVYTKVCIKNNATDFFLERYV